MSIHFAAHLVIDDTPFSPAVEMRLGTEAHIRKRVATLSGRLMSDEDIDGMVEDVVIDAFEWGREAKQLLAAAERNASR